MKQVLQSRGGLVTVRDVPEPHCPSGFVLVQNAFSAISSGTERARVDESQKSLLQRARERPELVREVARRAQTEGFRRTRASVKRKLAEESPAGYSSAGEVLRVGEAVRGLAPGMRVACAGAGHANHAEVVAVPANLCAKVPDSVSLEAAALTTIAAIALHSIRLAGVTVGDRVAVIGCGLVGQIACRLLYAAGAHVYAIDVDPKRLEDASAGGAEAAFEANRETEDAVRSLVPEGVDVALVTAAANANDPLLLGAQIARDRGTVILVGDVPVELPRAPLYAKELSFRISRSYGPGRYDLEYEERGLDYPIGYVRWTEQRNMQAILDLEARARLDLMPLISDVVPVDDAASAYASLAGEGAERPRGAILLAYGKPSPKIHASPPTVARRSASSDQIRIGLIGAGGFARSVLVPALIAAGASLEVVGGGSGPSSEAAKRELGFARVAADSRAVVDDPAVDAVVVATRHDSHAELVRYALEREKHVFCEKPLALDEEDLLQTIELARSSPAILFVGLNRRFSPFLREIRDFIPSSPAFSNYRVSAGTIAPSAWIHDLSQGGGRIIGEVCHFFDSLAYVARAPITSVAVVATNEPSLPRQAQDNIGVAFAHEGGSAGAISYVAAGAPEVAKERLEVFSGDRTAVLDDYRTLELYAGTDVRRRSSRQDKGHQAEVRAFLEGVRNATLPVPLEETANAHLASFAAVRSLQTGATIRVSVI